MKKQVDSRLRYLVEGCVKTRQRSLIVLVGDRGKDQVMNLHFLLHKLTSKKPSVLWCYKKDLGFSSHRKKRAKQIKKKIKKGAFDINIDDPFELFVSSTNIRFCYYKETQSVLGKTHGMCILQDFEALTPNILCRTIETVEGGGIVVLLLKTMSSLKQLYALSMDVHSKYRSGLCTNGDFEEDSGRIADGDCVGARDCDTTPRFNERFILSLAECRTCLVLDDELNVLPLSEHAKYISKENPIADLTDNERKTIKASSSTSLSSPSSSINGVEDDGHAVSPSSSSPVLVGCGLSPFLSPSQRELRSLQKQLIDTNPIGPILQSCVTLDQAKMLMSCADVLAEEQSSQAEGHANTKGRRSNVVVGITAGRGRGKSAGLGLSIATALAMDYSNVFVTAPSPENVETVFEFIVKGLERLGWREHEDFDITRELFDSTAAASPSSPSLSRQPGQHHQSHAGMFNGGGAISAAIKQQQLFKFQSTKINVYRKNRANNKGCVRYISPDQSTLLLQADLVVIDEAAAIPLPVVKRLIGHHTTFMSSTITGYEGTGRALSLKLLDELKCANKASENNKSTPLGSCRSCTVKEVSLGEPIRYATDDRLEGWMTDLLCLDATIPPSIKDSASKLVPPSACQLYMVNRDALFSYHAASEKFLHNLFALFVSSHYKNSPNDLQLLADAPHHRIFVLLPRLSANSSSLPPIYCAIQVCLEGALSKTTVRQSLSRGLRPAGDLLPWTIAQHFLEENFSSLSGVRIVRISCHPSLQRLGYGTVAMRSLLRFYENPVIELHENGGASDGASGGASESIVAGSLKQDHSRGNATAQVVNGSAKDNSDDESDIQDDDDNENDGQEDDDCGDDSDGDQSDGDDGGDGDDRGDGDDTGENKDGRSGNKDKHKHGDKKAESKSLLHTEKLRVREVSAPLLLELTSKVSEKNRKIDYIGTSFGLTYPLLMFWSRLKFLPVYLKHQPSEVTGEHSSIFLRYVHHVDGHRRTSDGGLNEGDDGPEGGDVSVRDDFNASDWLRGFVGDFRHRFVQNIASSFRHFSTTLALSLLDPPVSRGGADVKNEESSTASSTTLELVKALPSGLPPVTNMTLKQFITEFDVLRLKRYSMQLADKSLIIDLIPVISCLLFDGRFQGLSLSYLQAATMLGVGLQRKTVEELASEYAVPVNQLMALFNKAIRKVTNHIERLSDEAVLKGGRQIERKRKEYDGDDKNGHHEKARKAARDTGVRLSDGCASASGDGVIGSHPLPTSSLEDELNEGAADITREMKKQKQKLLLEALGSDTLRKYSMDGLTDSDFKAALKGKTLPSGHGGKVQGVENSGQVQTVVTLKRNDLSRFKNFSNEFPPDKISRPKK